MSNRILLSFFEGFLYAGYARVDLRRLLTSYDDIIYRSYDLMVGVISQYKSVYYSGVTLPRTLNN